VNAPRATALAALLVLAAACGQEPAKPPAQGTLVVRLVGADRKPYRYESTLSISWFPPDGNGSRSEVKLARGRAEASVEIPFGAKITLTALADGAWLAPEHVDPLTQEAPRRECSLSITHEPIKLLVRVIAPDGKPYEGGSVVARLGREPAEATRLVFPPEPKRLPDPTTIPLDAKGEAVLSLPAGAAALGATFMELGFRDLKGVVRLPEGLAPGEVALGDVTLSRPIPIASGVITGGDKKPIIGAELRVRAGAPPREIDASLLRVLRQERGRFSIEGWTGAKSCELVVEHDEHVTGEPRAFEVGAKDLQVVLERGGGVVLDATFPASKPLDALELWLEAEGARPVARARKAERGAEGRLRVVWRGVPAGSWSLRGRRGGDAVTLLEGLAVEAGTVCRDPRLAGLALDRLW